ncbi:hypothetical protein IJE86_08170 [bacterium]|nr:hypothetical protein [bacterium]
MDLKVEIKSKYEHLSDREVNLFINKAKAIAIDQLYPNDLSINYLSFDWTNPRFDMWLLDCVDELVERVGISSVTSYKENGMSWTFDRAGVSQALLDRLPRNIGIIR